MIGAKVPLCKQRACLYGRTGTNSFKGGSLPSEVIGPGGTKYFEEIGPGDQFLWGTIYFVTVRQLVQRNYRRDKVHTLQLEGYGKLDFMLLQAASSGECSYYRVRRRDTVPFHTVFLLVNHTYPSVLWEFCYNTQL